MGPHEREIVKTATFSLIGLLLVVLAFATAAHCRTANQQNSFGAVISDDNPNIYMFGSVVGGAVVQCGKGYCTNVTFNPHLTSTLHTESVLFCGDAADTFNGLRGPLVVTYRRQASRQINGIGCHNLETVYAIQETRP